jgi:hypothetical protein
MTSAALQLPIGDGAHETQAAPPAPRTGVLLAQLIQDAPESGLRGWRIVVSGPDTWKPYPTARLDRPGLRPPTIERRAEILAGLGFVPLLEERWVWDEMRAGYSHKSAVILFASITVQHINPKRGAGQ